MKILITGGCGFIGSNFIIKQIHDNNHTILNFDKLTYAGNSENLNFIEDNKHYSFVKGDISDFSFVSNICFSHDCKKLHF